MNTALKLLIQLLLGKSSTVFVWLLETGFYYVAQANPALEVLLLQPLEC